MRKARGRLYIKPYWVGWTGEAKMAYVITSTDPIRDDSRVGVVEFSVPKPAMENKWIFSRLDSSEFIRRSFYEFIQKQRFAMFLSKKIPT